MGDYDHSRNRTDSEVALRKIFIGGLSYGTDDDKLRKYFGVYGSVQDAVVMKDPVSRRSRGFGFITFSDISAVDNALAHEPHTIDARKVEAKRAVPRSEVSRDTGGPKIGVPVKPNAAGVGSSTGSSGAPGIGMASPSQTQIQNESRHAMDARISMDEYAYNKIFVGGLHYDTRDAEFRSYFERFGRVMSAEVMFNRETHKSRGFGFIVFELEKGAEQVCAEKEHVIDGKVVEVKRAIPRSRIGNNGAILPPSAAPTRAAGMGPGSGTGAGLGHLSPARPETPSASTATAVKPHTASAPPTVPGSKLRQDMRRSASMGSSMMSTVKPAARPSQQSLAASIAAIGVPSPRTKQGSTAVASPVVSVAVPVSRVAAGASYAAALRTGATSDDSETSITDQMLIASLQSDLLQVQSSNSSSLYGGLFTDSHAHPTSSVIERPPRSLSEPVIQLPNKMSADYFKSQLSLIQGRGGVAALGGAFNPVSPLLTSFGSISPLQKAIRSPVMTALASPLIPLPSLGLAWLSTSPAKASDSLIPDVPQLSPSASASASASASSDLFQPLPPSNTMMMPAGQIGQQQMLSRQQDFQQLQYMQQQFLQQQMQQMQQQQAYYQSQGLGLFNQTLINQQQMSMQMLNGQQQQQQTLGVYPAQVAGQGMQNQVQGTESVPSPLAWASMVTSPQQTQGQQQQQQQQQQQYFEPLLQPQAFQQGQGFYTTQQSMNQQQYYQQQQYHLQMQQHLQATGQYSMGAMGMVLPPGGISFNTPVQQQFMGTPYMTQADGSQPQAQTQAQTVIQGVALNGTATSPTAANGGGGGIGGNSLGLGVGVGTISSSSTVPRTSLQLEGSVAVVGAYENGSVSLGDGTSSAVGKDDLFLYEGLRLDGDAPEFEPQATRGW